MTTPTLKARTADKFIEVDGLRIRYVERGEGPVAVLLHGGSLGSSADVFERNLEPLAAAGFRAIAFDQPGFGLSDVPEDLSAGYRRDFVPKFLDALGIEKAALIGHSQAGNPAVNLALNDPARYTHIIVLGTGSLLPRKEGEGARCGRAATFGAAHGGLGAHAGRHAKPAGSQSLSSRFNHPGRT